MFNEYTPSIIVSGYFELKFFDNLSLFSITINVHMV